MDLATLLFKLNALPQLSPVFYTPHRHTEQCPCGTGSQTTEHQLQSCPLYELLRKGIWPDHTSVACKIYGSLGDFHVKFYLTFYDFSRLGKFYSTFHDFRRPSKFYFKFHFFLGKIKYISNSMTFFSFENVISNSMTFPGLKIFISDFITQSRIFFLNFKFDDSQAFKCLFKNSMNFQGLEIMIRNSPTCPAVNNL